MVDYVLLRKETRMLSDKVKQSLLSNWGEKAESMNCYAEVKFIDERSLWECYVYAMNPEDEDTIACLIVMPWSVEVKHGSLKDFYQCYNDFGENPEIDQEFRRTRVAELFKKLSEGRCHLKK